MEKSHFAQELHSFTNEELKSMFNAIKKELALVSLSKYTKQTGKNYNTLKTRPHIEIDGFRYIETRPDHDRT
jgi:hypothetical protein